MNLILYVLIPIVIAAIAVLFIHPQLVKIALLKSIVDRPNARRLNRKPVPVLGGAGVFFGILLSVSALSFLTDTAILYIIFAAMSLMLYTGIIDDILNIRSTTKFLLQILAVCILMFLGGYKINDLHGLWGIHELPNYVSYPLTVIACVGIINSINLIDGVDGLSSGFGIFTSTLLGVFFLHSGEPTFTILAFATAGAMIPFFMHNVFGRKYKMFIGDGGTLTLGIIFSVFVLEILSLKYEHINIEGIVSFSLAVFSIPVFDTLRVMTTRIAHKKSPFLPDKTHLHHMFIDMGYSHAMTTVHMLSLNIIIIIIWFITEYYTPLSQEVQLYIIVALSVAATTGLYYFTERLKKKYPEKYTQIKRHTQIRQLKHQNIYFKIQHFLDSL